MLGHSRYVGGHGDEPAMRWLRRRSWDMANPK